MPKGIKSNIEDKVNKKELERLYFDKQYSITKIGKMYGVCTEIISNLMDKYKIKKKPHGWWLKRGTERWKQMILNRSKPIKKLSKEEAIWVAAVIETDGCFYYSETSYGFTNVSIGVSQSEKRIELLERLKKIVGGYITKGSKGEYSKTEMYIWKLGGILALKSLIDQILPYIITQDKKIKAKRILNNCNEIMEIVDLANDRIRES